MSAGGRRNLDDILGEKLGQKGDERSTRAVLEEGDTVEALCSPHMSEHEPKRFTLGVIHQRGNDVDGSYDVELYNGRLVRGLRQKDVRLVRRKVPPLQAPPVEPFQVGDRVEAK